MLKVIMILSLIALYYFSAIEYKPVQNENLSFSKESKSWRFYQDETKELKTDHWLSYYLTFGKPPKDGEELNSKMINLNLFSK